MHDRIICQERKQERKSCHRCYRIKETILERFSPYERVMCWVLSIFSQYPFFHTLPSVWIERKKMTDNFFFKIWIKKKIREHEKLFFYLQVNFFLSFLFLLNQTKNNIFILVLSFLSIFFLSIHIYPLCYSTFHQLTLRPITLSILSLLSHYLASNA